jgi:uncharacterized protein DUF5667
MMIRIVVLLTLILILSSFRAVNASSYVLPYPSVMPGNIFYNLNLFKESVLRFWYFGDFGQFTFHLKQSDKYLVEAKTLFEYEQYFLATGALKKSDEYFEKTLGFLDSAKKSQKNIEKNRELLRQAGLKHIEVLERLKNGLPEAVVWTAEKEEPKTLMLKNQIDRSISLRTKYL